MKPEDFKPNGDKFGQRLDKYIKDIYVKELGISLDDGRFVDYKFTEEERAILQNRALYNDYMINIDLEKMEADDDKIQFELEYLNINTILGFMNLLYTRAAMCQIIDQMFLGLCMMRSGKVAITHGIDNDERKQISDYLKNFHHNKTSKETPFDYMPKEINGEIKSFGCDIVRLWIRSKSFRGLFRKVYSKSNKYSLKEIFNNDLHYILNTSENGLILDRLLSGNLICTLYDNIAPYIEDFSDEDFQYIIEFVEQVILCDANYLQCEIVKIVGNELVHLKEAAKLQRLKRLKFYTMCLKKIIPRINKNYDKLCDIAVDEIMQHMHYMEWANWLLEKKGIADCGNEYAVNYRMLHERFNGAGKTKPWDKVVQTIIEKNSEKYIKELD